MIRNNIHGQNQNNDLHQTQNSINLQIPNDIFCLNQLTESIESIPSNPFNLELFTHSSDINSSNINNINELQTPSLTAESPEYFDLDILQGLEFILPLSFNSELQTVSNNNTKERTHESLLRDTRDDDTENINCTPSITNPSITKPSTTTWKYVPHEIEYASRKNMEREKFNHSSLMIRPSSSTLIKKTTMESDKIMVMDNDYLNENKEHKKIKKESLSYNEEMEENEIEIAFIVSDCKDIDLNGLYTISGFRNGHIKYTKCIDQKTTIYCNPKRGWTISDHDNVIKYYSYPITKQPPTIDTNNTAHWIKNNNNIISTPNKNISINIKSSKNYGYNIIDLLFMGYIRDENINHHLKKCNMASFDIIDIFYIYFTTLIYDNCDNCKRECENVNLCGLKWLCKECNVEAMF